MSKDTDVICGCKGVRTCLLCEKWKCDLSEAEAPPCQAATPYLYCAECGAAWQQVEDSHQTHPHHEGRQIAFPGICVREGFITEEQERRLIAEIDNTQWKDSQSGRKKQDFGPKVNFKKKRLRTADFSGLPAYSQPLYTRLIQEVGVLSGFCPVELCNLDYDSERGSAIDAHFDDFWVWGDRLVTINMISDTFLTFTNDKESDVEVLVPMPRHSLIVVHGAARAEWKHAVKREHINGRRISICLRELTPEFLPGGARHTEGQALLDIALSFRGLAVGTADLISETS